MMVPEAFGQHAASYRERLDDAMARGEARGRNRVLELLDVQPGERVLDLGCGPGTLTLGLARAAGQVVAVDLAEGMLALLRETAPPNVQVARMDMERLGLRDTAFDAVACGHSLSFLFDLGAGLAEARRVLRPGGRFAASAPTDGAGPIRDAVNEVLEATLPPPMDLSVLRPTWETLTATDQARAALLAAGFRDAAATVVEELTRLTGVEELVARELSWWNQAWRLEKMSADEREQARAHAISELQARLGSGPLEVPGASVVLTATA